MFLLLLLTGVLIPPAAANAPNRQPQLAADGARVALAYGVGNTMYVAVSADGGGTFAAPVAVPSQGTLALGMHRGPRIAFTPDGLVVTAIVGKEGKGKDGDLFAWRSADGGRTWQAPVRINDVEGAPREGLHAMAFGGRDTLVTAWLDLREKGTRIYAAVSRDGGATWSPDRVVYASPAGTVCTCCHPSVAVSASGDVLVMFRNVLEGCRDLYLARSTDRGRSFGPPRRQGEGTWKIEACPMDGGQIAVDARGAVATIWRRDQTVFTTHGGASETSLGPGRNPTLAETDRGLFAAWTRGSAVVVARPGATDPEVLDEEGAFPSMTALGDGSVAVAWESNGAIAVRAIR